MASVPDYEMTVSGPANYQNVVAVTYQASSAGQFSPLVSL